MVSMILKWLFYTEADRITAKMYNASPESRLLESRGLCLVRDLYPVDLTLRNPAQGAMLAFLALKCVQSSL